MAEDEVLLWNVESSEIPWQLPDHAIGAVAFSSDGRRMAAGFYALSGNDWPRMIRLWNARTKEPERDLVGHSGWVMSIAFSSDGRLLASASEDRTIRIWDVETGQTKEILSGHSSLVWAVAFSPDGGRLVSGSSDKTIRIWSINAGEYKSTAVQNSPWVWSVRFIRRGETIVSRSGNNTVQIRNAKTGDLEKKLTEATLGKYRLQTVHLALVSHHRQSAHSFPDLIPLYNPFQNPDSINVHCKLAPGGEYFSFQSESDPERKRLWIWSDYQHGISCTAFQGTRVCMGYKSGRVVIIDLAEL
jgi:WD40 repeat protein